MPQMKLLRGVTVGLVLKDGSFCPSSGSEHGMQPRSRQRGMREPGVARNAKGDSLGTMGTIGDNGRA